MIGEEVLWYWLFGVFCCGCCGVDFEGIVGDEVVVVELGECGVYSVFLFDVVVVKCFFGLGEVVCSLWV